MSLRLWIDSWWCGKSECCTSPHQDSAEGSGFKVTPPLAAWEQRLLLSCTMRLVIRQDYDEVSAWIGKTPFVSFSRTTLNKCSTAHYIKERINQFQPTKERPFVLGLPTGSSPIGCYHRLANFCKNGELSFKHVVTFNMDEYVGIPR